MTKPGDLITVNGRPEIVVEAEMILRDGKPFYVALKSEPIGSDQDDDISR